jgi:hypothetical protein
MVLIEELEDTKGAIRIRISKKNRQHNGKRKSTKGQMETGVPGEKHQTVASH